MSDGNNYFSKMSLFYLFLSNDPRITVDFDSAISRCLKNNK